MNENANIAFKVLRVADPSVIGGSKPVEVSKIEPAQVHFSNAKGGFKMASIGDIRLCAAASAKRTKQRLAQV